MKFNSLILILLFSTFNYGQNIKSINNKLGIKICNCLSTIDKESSINKEFNKCTDSVFKNKNNILSSEELELLKDPQNLEAVKKGLFLLVNQNCIYIQNRYQPANSESEKKEEFPVNFSPEQYNQLSNLENKLITLEGTVVKVIDNNGFPYSKLQFGEHNLLVSSLLNSGFETEGAIIRVLGYVVPISKEKHLKKMQKKQLFQINAYGLVNMKTKDFAYFPGLENKMSAWRNGAVPN